MTLTAKAAYKYQDYLINAVTAKPLTGYYVRIFNAGTATPATKYTDDTGSLPDSTDITTDSVGFFSCFLAPDFYDVRFYSNSLDYTNDTNPITSLTDVMIDGFTTATASSTSFTPNGDIAANTVQAALQEVRDEYEVADTTLQANIDALTTRLTTSTFSTIEQNITSTGQTAFTISTPYVVGNNSLMIFNNGIFQPRTTYVETDTTTITFNDYIPAGKTITVRQFVFTVPA